MAVTTVTPEKSWRPAFLKSLAKIPNITVACEAAGISRKTPYRDRHEDPDFALDWDEAITQGIERLEQECWRRAHDGVPRKVWMKDKDRTPVAVDEICEYSDTLAIFLLKAHAPDKYRERIQQTINARVETAPAGAIESLTEPELRSIIALAERTSPVDSVVPTKPVNGNGHNGNGNGSH